jgi:hypothetical protein
MAEDDNDNVEIIPPRRRPGRPRRNGLDAPDVTLLHPDGEEGAKKKPRSRRSKADRIAEMAEEIKGAHELMAAMLGMPFLAISEDSARRLAGPAHAVAEKYGWTSGLDNWPEIKLLFVLGAVYGPLTVQVQQEILRRKADAAHPAHAHPPGAAPAAEAPGSGAPQDTVYHPDFVPGFDPTPDQHDVGRDGDGQF